MKFFIYHTVSKNPERVFPETQKQFFSALKTSEKTNLPLRKIKFFHQKVFGKKSRIIPKKRPLRFNKRF